MRYVLSGSVRKAAGHVRISAQLAETASGNHIWAGKFDGELANIFDLQDRVTKSVVAAMEPSLRHAEVERARRKPTDKLDAYDCYLRALPPFYSRGRRTRRFPKASRSQPWWVTRRISETIDDPETIFDPKIWDTPGFALVLSWLAQKWQRRCHKLAPRGSKKLTEEQQKACLDSAAAELIREITHGRSLN